MKPKITIIIPTFNRAAYLKQAIESARAQDYPDLEIVVSDNASNDETAEIVAQYINDRRFKYYSNPTNIGMVANWRKALYEYASGDFFLILSDDDYLIDTTYLTKAVDLIQSDPKIMLVYANGYIANDSDIVIALDLPFSTIEDGEKIFLSRGTVAPQDFTLCNILFNRRLASALNAFSNIHNISCDSELFLKMCLYGSVGIIKDHVSVYRMHGDNLINRVKDEFNLLIHNLDHLIEPFNLAKKLNRFSLAELNEWENRLIVPSITDALLTALIHHKKHFPQILTILENKNWDSYKTISRKIKFKIQLAIAKRSNILLYCISASFRRKVARERKL